MGCLSILEHIQGWGRCQDISGASLNLSEEIPHRTCLGLPNLGHPHLHLRANSSKAQHLYGCCQVLRKTLQTNEGYHKLWYQCTLMWCCVSGWNALCLACYTHHVGWGRRGLPKLWIRRESRLLDRVMGSRFPLDGLWHIIRRHQYFDLDTFGMKIEKCVSRGLYPKPPWLLLNIVVSCHAPHIVEFHLWAHFVVIFSRKFLDGRVEERADFLTPLSLPGMSRIENNWGCLAQIGEIATTFGIVALWPILALFSWRGSLSRGFFKRFRSKKRRLRWMKKVSSAFYMQHTFVAAYALHPEYRTA